MAFQDALQYAKQNPNSDYANQFRQRLESGDFNDQAKAAGYDPAKYGWGQPKQPAPTQRSQPAQPGQQGTFLHPLDALSQQYKGAIDTAKEGITSGAQTMDKGGLGNTLHGAAQAGLGAAGAATQAVFAPFSASADAVVPEGTTPVGKVASGAAKGGIIGAELGSIIPGAGTLVGGGIGALFGGGLSIVNQVKDAIFAHSNISEADKAMVNNALNVGLAALGEKTGEAKSGEAGGLNTPVSEIPGNLNKSIVQPIKGMGTKLSEAMTPKAPTPEQAQVQTDAKILEKYNKAIKPSMAGKGTKAQVDSYNNQAIEGVKTIVANKANMNLIDESGEKVSLPHSIEQASEALDQTREQIFKQYDALQKAAGEKGATVDLHPIAEQLRSITDSKILQDKNPEVVSYAQRMAETLARRGSYSPQEAQDIVKSYNADLKGLYKNPSPGSFDRVMVDSFIAKMLRSGLDSSIENASPEASRARSAEGQPTYQELKSKYGALRAMESDLTKASLRQSKLSPSGLIDSLTSVGSGVEFARALLRMNPVDMVGSAAIKGIGEYIKWRNNPNTLIKEMFEAADSGSTNGATQKAGEAPTSQNQSNPATSQLSQQSKALSNDSINKLKGQAPKGEGAPAPKTGEGFLTQEANKGAVDERLAPLTDKNGMVTVYRAAPNFPADIFTKDTHFATDPKNARYYAESHYTGNPSDITVRSVKVPASQLKRGGSADSWQLKADYPVVKEEGPASPKTALQKVSSYIQEFFGMAKKAPIKNPQEVVDFGDNVRIRRTGLKHIVEGRIEDGYSSADIASMMNRAPDVIKNPDKDILNNNQTYKGSRLAAKLYPDEKRALLVLYEPNGEIKDIYNAYYRGKGKFEKIVEQ